MTSIINYLKEHETLCLGLSVAALGAYLFVRNKPTKIAEKKSMLPVSLADLIKRSRHPNIKKIVITCSRQSEGSLRRNLINYIKTRLSDENVKVLINCSPQRLLEAGCECFLQSMQNNDVDYVHYYTEALKAQFLIEDTIINIESINEVKGPIIMICDNNPMDIRLMNESDSLWYEALSKNGIKEEDVEKGYDLILHVIEQSGFTQQDQRIAGFWDDHEAYHQIRAKKDNLRQKEEEVYVLIRKIIETNKVKPMPE